MEVDCWIAWGADHGRVLENEVGVLWYVWRGSLGSEAESGTQYSSTFGMNYSVSDLKEQSREMDLAFYMMPRLGWEPELVCNFSEAPLILYQDEKIPCG